MVRFRRGDDEEAGAFKQAFHIESDNFGYARPTTHPNKKWKAVILAFTVVIIFVVYILIHTTSGKEKQFIPPEKLFISKQDLKEILSSVNSLYPTTKTYFPLVSLSLLPKGYVYLLPPVEKDPPEFYTLVYDSVQDLAPLSPSKNLRSEIYFDYKNGKYYTKDGYNPDKCKLVVLDKSIDVVIDDPDNNENSTIRINLPDDLDFSTSGPDVRGICQDVVNTTFPRPVDQDTKGWTHQTLVDEEQIDAGNNQKSNVFGFGTLTKYMNNSYLECNGRDSSLVVQNCPPDEDCSHGRCTYKYFYAGRGKCNKYDLNDQICLKALTSGRDLTDFKAKDMMYPFDESRYIRCNFEIDKVSKYVSEKCPADASIFNVKKSICEKRNVCQGRLDNTLLPYDEDADDENIYYYKCMDGKPVKMSCATKFNGSTLLPKAAGQVGCTESPCFGQNMNSVIYNYIEEKDIRLLYNTKDLKIGVVKCQNGLKIKEVQPARMKVKREPLLVDGTRQTKVDSVIKNSLFLEYDTPEYYLDENDNTVVVNTYTDLPKSYFKQNAIRIRSTILDNNALFGPLVWSLYFKIDSPSGRNGGNDTKTRTPKPFVNGTPKILNSRDLSRVKIGNQYNDTILALGIKQRNQIYSLKRKRNAAYGDDNLPSFVLDTSYDLLNGTEFAYFFTYNNLKLSKRPDLKDQIFVFTTYNSTLTVKNFMEGMDVDGQNLLYSFGYQKLQSYDFSQKVEYDNTDPECSMDIPVFNVYYYSKHSTDENKTMCLNGKRTPEVKDLPCAEKFKLTPNVKCQNCVELVNFSLMWTDVDGKQINKDPITMYGINTSTQGNNIINYLKLEEDKNKPSTSSPLSNSNRTVVAESDDENKKYF